MSLDNEDINDLKLGVGLLTKDVEQTNTLCEKLSESIEKLQEVNVNILRMITLHELKHDQHEKSEAEMKDDIKELHSRITTVDRNLSDKIELTERRIMDEIKALRECIDQHNEKEEADMLKLSQWRWMVAGGVIVFAWLVSNVKLEMLAKLFQ